MIVHGAVTRGEANDFVTLGRQKDIMTAEGSGGVVDAVQKVLVQCVLDLSDQKTKAQ